MNYFFEPVNLTQWNMFEEVKFVNHIETFLATKNMQLNDIVLLHVGKQSKMKKSGVYAWGIIVKEPYIYKGRIEEYCNNKLSVDVKIIYIKYDIPFVKTDNDKIFQQYRTVHMLDANTISKLYALLPDNFFEFPILKNRLSEEVMLLDKELEKQNINIDEKVVLAKSRIGQSTFKKILMKKYNNRCCICNLANSELLIASHIKEWSESNVFEKGDINNGLLLCTLHDSLFDKHLISFDKSGKIVFSNKLTSEDKVILNLNKEIKIFLTEEMQEYMRYHREKTIK